MLGHFQIFVSALVFGVNIRFGIYDVPPTVFVYQYTTLARATSLIINIIEYSTPWLEIFGIEGQYSRHQPEGYLGRRPYQQHPDLVGKVEELESYGKDCCKYSLPSGRDVEGELTGSGEGLYIPKGMVTMAADFLRVNLLKSNQEDEIRGSDKTSGCPHRANG